MKNKVVISSIIVLFLMILGFYFKNQISTGSAHLGFSAKYTKTLTPGIYKGDQLKHIGKYAVLSKKGTGYITVTSNHSSHKIKLNDELIKKINRDAPSQLTQIGFEEGKKITIKTSDTITIKSNDPDFKLLLIMR